MLESDARRSAAVFDDVVAWLRDADPETLVTRAQLSSPKGTITFIDLLPRYAAAVAMLAADAAAAEPGDDADAAAEAALARAEDAVDEPETAADAADDAAESADATPVPDAATLRLRASFGPLAAACAHELRGADGGGLAIVRGLPCSDEPRALAAAAALSTALGRAVPQASSARGHCF